MKQVLRGGNYYLADNQGRCEMRLYAWTDDRVQNACIGAWRAVIGKGGITYRNVNPLFEASYRKDNGILYSLKQRVPLVRIKDERVAQEAFERMQSAGVPL